MRRGEKAFRLCARIRPCFGGSQFDVLAAVTVLEVCGGGRLVGALVLRKARIAVDAEHRTAHWPRIGVEVAADRAQAHAEIGDEAEHRLLHLGLVPILVCLKPLSIVVGPQLLQEPKKPGAEVGGLDRACTDLR